MAADIVSSAKRSEMMAGIRGKNTKPELIIRKALHAVGFRYRLHEKTLPGKPDLVFPKHNAVIFIHGCFWHGHDCPLFRMPASRPEFWEKKISRNREVDASSTSRLLESGWRVGIVWECAIRGKNKQSVSDVIETCGNWLLSENKDLEIRSNP
jgi:DNA mismatch endonuclease (patch repair protein)